jgi:membrane dipeptidase
MPEPDLSTRARELHFDSIVFDGLEAAPMTAEHFERLRRGGVHFVQHTCAKVTDDFSAASLNFLRLQRTIEEHSDQVTLVRSGADIDRALATGKLGLIAGFQSPSPLMGNLDFVELLYQLGVLVIQLTYNERSLLGDGCIEAADAGLSRFGLRVIEEMNRLGMLIDLSHCGERTTLEAIQASRLPVLISHANAKALCPSMRNKNDHVLAALAENRGVIGAVFWAPLTYRHPDLRPDSEDLLNHIDHLVQQAGIDHVGIGSDIGEGEARADYEAMFAHGGGIYPEVTRMLGSWYGWDNRMVAGLESVVDFPAVTEGLVRRDYPPEDIQKILGGNFLRIFSEVMG